MKPATINFPGEHKAVLKIEAAKRGTTMEKLILRAFEAYLLRPQKVTGEVSVLESEPDQLASTIPVISNSQENINGDTLHKLASDLSEPEVEFLRECLGIYRSGFGYAVEQLIAMLQSGDIGLTNAILSNLAVFTRLVVMGNERRSGDVSDSATATPESVSEELGAARAGIERLAQRIRDAERNAERLGDEDTDAPERSGT